MKLWFDLEKSNREQNLYVSQIVYNIVVTFGEYRKKMANAIGQDAYNGVNLFEGTEPLASSEPAKGRADLGDPRDAGVDISSILGDSMAIWQAMK